MTRDLEAERPTLLIDDEIRDPPLAVAQSREVTAPTCAGPASLRPDTLLAKKLVDMGSLGRLWEGLESLEKDYQVEAASSPSGATHLTFTHLP
jgi:hypothetical protein